MLIFLVREARRVTVHISRNVTTGGHELRRDGWFLFKSVRDVYLQNSGMRPDKRMSWVPQREIFTQPSFCVTIPFFKEMRAVQRLCGRM